MELEEVSPDTTRWDLFLKFSAEYLKESWTKKFPDSISEVSKAYEKILLNRIAEGGRYLFLLKDKEDYVGLANVYLAPRAAPESENKVLTLHIAEFSIRPGWRRQQLGSAFLELLIQFGLRQEMKMVWVEVDRSLVSATEFWKKHFNQAVDGESRLSFWKCF